MHLLRGFALVLFVLTWAHVHADDEYVEHGGPNLDKNHDREHYADGEHDSEFDHRAFLGDREDAAMHDLPPEEAKARLKKIIVGRVDTNHDGFVDKQELTDQVLRSLRETNYEFAKDVFVRADTDKDGLLTWDEYVRDNYGEFDLAELENDKSEDNVELKKLYQDEEKKWKIADANGDGKLTLEEYQAFSQPEDFDRTRSAELDRIMADYDRNGDGTITFKEFLLDALNKDEEHQVALKEQFDRDYDKNHDGVLDRDELRQWALPTPEETASGEAQHLLEIADLDHDGKLSIDEILRSHDAFAGSQATNYGEDLHKIKDEL